jgi:hypothetical protein
MLKQLKAIDGDATRNIVKNVTLNIGHQIPYMLDQVLLMLMLVYVVWVTNVLIGQIINHLNCFQSSFYFFYLNMYTWIIICLIVMSFFQESIITLMIIESWIASDSYASLEEYITLCKFTWSLFSSILVQNIDSK